MRHRRIMGLTLCRRKLTHVLIGAEYGARLETSSNWRVGPTNEQPLWRRSNAPLRHIGAPVGSGGWTTPLPFATMKLPAVLRSVNVCFGS